MEKNLVQNITFRKIESKHYEGEIENLEKLSEVQEKALAEINEGFRDGKNVLLHGVTSSGKTHLYLEKIEETIANGKNVLFLLPEML